MTNDCTHTSPTGSARWTNRDTATICSANSAAPASVSASPRPSASPSRSESSAEPVSAIASPTTRRAPGRSRTRSQAQNAVSRIPAQVRNAELPALVQRRPSAWSQNPPARSTPESAPPVRSARPSCRRMASSTSASTRPATRKRDATSVAGGIAATASRMATNVPPQSRHASTIAATARRSIPVVNSGSRRSLRDALPAVRGPCAAGLLARAGERGGEALELHGHVHGAERHVLGDAQLPRREVEDAQDAGGHERVRDGLGGGGGRGDDADLAALARGELGHGAHREALHGAADALGVGVEHGHDVEALLGEAAVAQERAADVARAHHAHAPAPVEAEQCADLLAQVLDVVAEAAPAERAERGQVLPHLRRGDALALGEQVRRDHALALGGDLLEHAVVVREPPDRGFRDVRHALLVNPFTMGGERSAAEVARRGLAPALRLRATPRRAPRRAPRSPAAALRRPPPRRRRHRPPRPRA